MTMKNIEISILGEIGFLLEMDDKVMDKKLTNTKYLQSKII